jgi:Flp pilus assembly protein protease CpaA
MNPALLRWIGFLILVAAIAVAILNLHRVADLRLPWLAPLLIVLGAAFVVFARRLQR